MGIDVDDYAQLLGLCADLANDPSRAAAAEKLTLADHDEWHGTGDKGS